MQCTVCGEACALNDVEYLGGLAHARCIPRRGVLFTARHYRWFARMFKELRPDPTVPGQALGWAVRERQWLDTVERFEALFIADNPAFDPHRFRVAIGLETLEPDTDWTEDRLARAWAPKEAQ